TVASARLPAPLSAFVVTTGSVTHGGWAAAITTAGETGDRPGAANKVAASTSARPPRIRVIVCTLEKRHQGSSERRRDRRSPTAREPRAPGGAPLLLSLGRLVS